MPVISSGNMCRCSFGLVPIPLTSTNETVKVEGMSIITNIDTSTLISFGMCKTPSNPAVLAIIILSKGTITQAPCKSAIITPWIPSKPTVLACGKPVCTSGSTCQCTWGGKITIINVKNHRVL